MRRVPGKVKNQTSGLKFRSRDGLSLHDDNIDMTTEGESIPPPDDDNHMDTKEGDSIPSPDEHNHMDTEDAIFQHNDNIDMTTEGDSIPRPDDDTHVDTKGEERWEHGVNMGHGIQRLTGARRGKLPLVLAKEMTRPITPVIAAKFATECNIVVRNHVPILKH
ncbi:hypothetical protein GUJ93_ZPchr0012g21035 [Zizania palustris]|uniref:Uncharacterized protein n=1 Tax=Zizania palustris TaxID=103762 RepID=A0A8J5WWK1_ZIZPA|nr:hypothetical protein GUJ93_ZPchr0012g21035 [Zizania palustris]